MKLSRPACCDPAMHLPCATADVACKTDVYAPMAAGRWKVCCRPPRWATRVPTTGCAFASSFCSALLFSSSKLSHAAQLHTSGLMPLSQLPFDGVLNVDLGKFPGVWPAFGESICAGMSAQGCALPCATPSAPARACKAAHVQTLGHPYGSHLTSSANHVHVCIDAVCRCSRFWAASP